MPVRGLSALRARGPLAAHKAALCCHTVVSLYGPLLVQPEPRSTHSTLDKAPTVSLVLRER